MSVNTLRTLSCLVLYHPVVTLLAPQSALAGSEETRWEGMVEAAYQSGFAQDNVSKALPDRRGDASAKVDLAMDGFSYAEAIGFAAGLDSLTIDGSDVSSRSRAGGFDPGFGPPDESLWAEADFESNIYWWSQSNTLPVGRPITVEVTLDIEGEIVASGSSNLSPFAAFASAYVGLDKTDGPGGSLNYFGAVNAIVSPDDGFGEPPVLSAGGDWTNSDFVQTPLNSPLGVLQKFELDKTETLTFASRIGDPFTMLLDAPTTVDTIGPFENLAVADISASYRLRALDPVTGQSLFPMEFAALPVLPGTQDADFDDDDDIDGHDFLQWQRNFGSLAAKHQDGDADLDRDVDNEDLRIWEQMYGISPIRLLSTTSVPEPTSWLLAIVGITCQCCLNRRFNR